MIAQMAADRGLIESVVREVLAELGGQATAAGGAAPGAAGVFRSVDDAVAAANAAYAALRERPIADRARAIACIRRIVIDQAEQLGRAELDETRIGRLEHKIEKLRIIGERIPGVEFLQAQAAVGDHGLTITEHGPFGTIGVVTPVTHSLPTLAANAINMIAAGNTLVCNPHPAGARIACEGARRFNEAIRHAIGIDNLIAIIEQPTLETAQAIFEHPGIRLLCVTGGPGVARAALGSRKRAVVAGPGNPPVVVDGTADAARAARSTVMGASYDNNLLCIGEKQAFVVEPVFAAFLEELERHGGFRLDAAQVAALTAAAFVPADGQPGKQAVNKELIGQDPQVLADRIGLRLPAGVQLLFGETPAEHPFVEHEQMMPFLPVVRTRDSDEAIARAKESEHGFRHTSVIHSRDVEAMTRMGRALETTLFIKNGPSIAGLGIGGEGFCSFSIAGPTGEGPTNPLTFTRHRRCAMVDALRIA
jgi:aldehyde dehydrogenase